MWPALLRRRMNRTTPQPPSGARAGLTLIEVMLTMVILSIAGIVLITAVSQSLAVVRAARLYNQAQLLLAQVELEHPLFDEDVEVGTERGRFAQTDAGPFDWERTIDVVGDEEDRLFEVRTRISWSRQRHSGFEEVVTYRYAPEEDDL